MKKFTLVLFILVLFHIILPAGQTGTIAGIDKPQQMVISPDGNRLYIVQGVEVFVYSLKDLKFIKKFDKKGEGPGETLAFTFAPNGFAATGKNLYLDGQHKIITYSSEGKFLKEVKKPGNITNVLPIGDGFAGIRLLHPSKEQKQAMMNLYLADGALKATASLYRQVLNQQGLQLICPPDPVTFAVYDNKIFVERSAEGYIIDVFDGTGKSLYRIQRDVPPRKITSGDRELELREFKLDGLLKTQATQAGGWDEMFKILKLRYRDTYPPIRDMLVKDGKIYLRTHDIKDGKEKYDILDLEGKHLKTVYLPKPMLQSFAGRISSRTARLYDISGGTFYYLKEDVEGETWKLHSADIK